MRGLGRGTGGVPGLFEVALGHRRQDRRPMRDKVQDFAARPGFGSDARHRQAAMFSMILPICALLSISSCALATASNGKTAWMIGA